MMFKKIPVLVATLLLATSFSGQAEGLSREQVKMDRDTFLALMRWDEMTGQWVLKSGMQPPASVKSRAEVIQMRDDFLRMHRWDEASGSWIPLKAARDMSNMSRDEVHMETVRFTMMYRWDERMNDWVARNR